jgi:hypothetical protein
VEELGFERLDRRDKTLCREAQWEMLGLCEPWQVSLLAVAK